MKASSDVSSRRWASTLTCSGPNPPAHDRRRQTRRAGVGEPAVAPGGPLHRRAHGVAALGRRAPRPCRSPRRRTARGCRGGRTAGCRPCGCGGGRRRASMAGAGAARGRRSACPGSGRTPRRPPAAPCSVSLSSVSSSWLRTKVAHWHAGGSGGRAVSALASGRASPRAIERYSFCIPMKSKSICSSSPSSPKNFCWSLCGQVHLAEEHGVAGPPRHERPELPQVLRAGRRRPCRRRCRACSMKNGTASTRKPGHPELQPEADDLLDLVAHRRVGHVQVGLVAVEAVEVVRAGLLVVGPDARLLVGEHDVGRLGGRRVVVPHVPVAVRASVGLDRAARNHGCRSEVWFTTRSRMTRIPGHGRCAPARRSRRGSRGGGRPRSGR